MLFNNFVVRPIAWDVGASVLDDFEESAETKIDKTV
jgi:hypothetical protein